MTRATRLAAVLALTGACGSAPKPSTEQVDPEIRELSGWTRSQRDPSLRWAHGDSGTQATLFAVDDAGRIHARVHLLDVANVDWEDITLHAGELYLGDIGNNGQSRRDLVVYRLPEPDPRGGDQSLRPSARIPWHFPDQREFPASVANFDAEALFWARGDLYLLSKHRADTATTLYRFGALEADAGERGESVELERLADFEVGGAELEHGGMVTAAEVDADGRKLAVLTYHALFVFDVDHEGPLLSRLESRLDFDMSKLDQCEALTWDGDRVLIANESGRVFRVDAATRKAGKTFPAG